MIVLTLCLRHISAKADPSDREVCIRILKLARITQESSKLTYSQASLLILYRTVVYAIHPLTTLRCRTHQDAVQSVIRRTDDEL